MFAQRKCPKCRERDEVSAEWICSSRDRFNYFFGLTPRICKRCTLRFFVFSEWAAPGLWILFIILFGAVFLRDPGNLRLSLWESNPERSRQHSPVTEAEEVPPVQVPVPKESLDTVVESIIMYDLNAENPAAEISLPTAELSRSPVEEPAPVAEISDSVAQQPAPVEEMSPPAAEQPFSGADLPAPDTKIYLSAAVADRVKPVGKKTASLPASLNSRIYIRPLLR